MHWWSVAPSRLDQHAILDALLREGMAAEAYKVVAKQMDADGAHPDLPEFERVIRAFRDRGSLDAVKGSLVSPVLLGYQPIKFE